MRNHSIRNWLANEDELLTEHWRLLDCSARQIAKMLDRTRNAVIGRARRLGLAFKVRPPTAPSLPRARSVKKVVAVPRPEPEVTPLPMGMHPIMQLSWNTCRYPIGTPGDANFRFCCKRSHGTSSYCEHHWRLCTWRRAA